MSRPIRIHCVHTAAIHEGTFTRLFGVAAPEVTLVHSVRPDWLAHARELGLDAALSDAVGHAITRATEDADAVLLSCSTLGPLADAAKNPRVVRIDTPLMRRAAEQDGTTLLAICLDSTRAATVALFEAACVQAGKAATYRVALCQDAWPFFEQGETDRFARAVSDAVRRSISTVGPVGAVVLAQASMAVAESLLADIGIPVYSSPCLAVAETLRVAEQHRQEKRACA